MTNKHTLIVCAACGKVLGEHGGWDESCVMHAVEVFVDGSVRGDGGRIIKADSTGREPTSEERWPRSSP